MARNRSYLVNPGQVVKSGDLSATDAARVAAEAAAVAAAADRVQTGLDRTQTGLDRTQTGLDRTQTGNDRTQTTADRAVTTADRAVTTADRAVTTADRAVTTADRAVTTADRAVTTADRAVTTADRTQTGLDRTQTGLDRTQTGLDRTQTGLDRIAAADSAALAATFNLTDYYTKVETNTAFAPISHTHPTSQITGLDTMLAGYAPLSHTHPTSQITGLDTMLAGYAPISHTHPTSQITGLDTALASKFDKTGGTISGSVVLTGGLTVGSGATSSQITMADSDEGQRYIHNNSTTIGFLGSDGNWKLRVYDSGAVWTAQFGDLNTRIEDRAYAWAENRALAYYNAGVSQCATGGGGDYATYDGWSDVGSSHHMITAVHLISYGLTAYRTRNLYYYRAAYGWSLFGGI